MLLTPTSQFLGATTKGREGGMRFDTNKTAEMYDEPSSQKCQSGRSLMVHGGDHAELDWPTLGYLGPNWVTVDHVTLGQAGAT